MDYYNEIYQNLGNYQVLERLFRESPLEFRRAFQKVYEDNPESHVLDIWKARLDYSDSKSLSSKPASHSNIVRLIVISALVGLLANLPIFLELEITYYTFFVPALVLLGMTAYLAMTEKPPLPVKLIVFSIFGLSLIHLVRLYTKDPNLDSQIVEMALLNLPFFLWALAGLIYMGKEHGNPQRRIDFIKLTGETIIYSVIIGASFGSLLLVAQMLSMSHDGFFNFFMGEYAMPMFIAATPIAAIGLAKQNLGIRRVPGYIARLISPIILIVMIIYGISLFFSGDNPLHDRELVIGLNGLLIGIVGILFFVLSERRGRGRKNFGDYITFATVIVALLLDFFNISAIVYRSFLTGLTPTRFVVIGVNVLVLINLIRLSMHFLNFLRDRQDSITPLVSIVKYMPIYVL